MSLSENKPKMLTPVRLKTNQLDRHRLGPKGTWPSSGVPNSPDADLAPERRDLTHSGTHAERGKPVVLPMARLRPQDRSRTQGKASRKANPRDCGYGSVEKANAVL